MPVQLFEYPGAILALVLLWRFGPKPFTKLRWFTILSTAVVGATVAGFIPTYRAAAAFATMMGDPIDLAAVSGEVLGGAIVTGGFVGLVAIIANVMKRRENRNWTAATTAAG